MPQVMSAPMLKSLCNTWRDLGLATSVLEPLETFVDREAAMKAEFEAVMADDDDYYAKVAAGDLSLAEALAAERRSARTEEGRARVRSVYSSARDALLRQVSRTLRELGDSLVSEHLGPAHAAIIDEASGLLDAVEGVEEDGDAIKASPKTREAWARLTVLAEKRAAIVQALRDLSRVLPPLVKDDGRGRPPTRLFRQPELLPPSRALKGHPARVLAKLIQSGAQPGIYTAAEVAEHRVALVEADREAQRQASKAAVETPA